jgi:hypothetical protein
MKEILLRVSTGYAEAHGFLLFVVVLFLVIVLVVGGALLCGEEGRGGKRQEGE